MTDVFPFIPSRANETLSRLTDLYAEAKELLGNPPETRAAEVDVAALWGKDSASRDELLLLAQAHRTHYQWWMRRAGDLLKEMKLLIRAQFPSSSDQMSAIETRVFLVNILSAVDLCQKLDRKVSALWNPNLCDHDADMHDVLWRRASTTVVRL